MLTKEATFKSVIESCPHMTTNIIRAKKHLLSALETFEDEIKNAIKLLSDLITSIERIIDQSE